MNTVASREDWLKARMELLAVEKAFTEKRDALSAMRRKMPWVKIDTGYVFDGPEGHVSLDELFEGRGQLFVYHFMFGPDWEWGCKSCSFWSDQWDGAIPHLNARDTSFVAISRAPVEKLARHKARMGWKFPWVSSGRNSFNFDFGVSFEPDDEGKADYNFTRQVVPMKELQGLSVFARGGDGAIYHTYSTYGRGQDILNGAYNMLDMTPKGRDEDRLPFTMQWVKLHDEYAS